ncbi:MAG TPA: ABC transporter substrate-binding protein [Candidatus Binatia bacterium]|nr:ABC transporter substrate-binding protein [Candidatus Binatia bacterium]
MMQTPKSKVKIVIVLFLITLLRSHIAEAQQQMNVPRIGVLINGSPSTHKYQIDPFRQSLHELGWVEGKTVLIDYRYGHGKLDRLSELARELADLKVDVIYASATPATVAAKKATRTIPIVFTGVGDPVGSGLVESLAKPGANVTGFAILSPEMGGKRLELLKEAFPRVKRIAFFWSPSASTTVAVKAIRVAAEALRLQIQSLEVRSSDDFASVFDAVTKQQAQALLMNPSPVLGSHRMLIIQFAAKNRLPAMYANSEFVESGGLMSYAHSNADAYKRAAVYVDKILKGAKPADLPVEQPMKFELLINLKTAKQIGVTIPPNVLARADRVIR